MNGALCNFFFLSILSSKHVTFNSFNLNCNHIIFSLKCSVRAYEHPGFVLKLILKQNKIIFEPDFKDFEVALLTVYDTMVKCVSLVPRVETQLYSEWVRVRGLYSFAFISERLSRFFSAFSCVVREPYFVCFILDSRSTMSCYKINVLVFKTNEFFFSAKTLYY